jgi:large subunit ribosomal protein L22
MPRWGYSVTGLDPSKTAYASGRDLRISPKAAREICRFIRGMKLSEAMDFLQRVINKQTAVPYRRYKKKVPHRREIQKWPTGRYPVKAARSILRVLENADVNAMEKNLDLERLRILHASALKGVKLRRYIPRAFGRASPRFEQLCHVEIVVGEKE